MPVLASPDSRCIAEEIEMTGSNLFLAQVEFTKVDTDLYV
jgi:hypothetical protein